MIVRRSGWEDASSITPAERALDALSGATPARPKSPRPPVVPSRPSCGKESIDVDAVPPPEAEKRRPPSVAAKSTTSDSMFSDPCPTTQAWLPPGCSRWVAVLQASQAGSRPPSPRSGDVGSVEGRVQLWDERETDRDCALHASSRDRCQGHNHRRGSCSALTGTALLDCLHGTRGHRDHPHRASRSMCSPLLRTTGAGWRRHRHPYVGRMRTMVKRCSAAIAIRFVRLPPRMLRPDFIGQVRIPRSWSKERAVLQGNWDQVRSVSFAPASPTLAFGCGDHTVRVYDLSASAPKPKQVLRGHLGVVRVVQFSRDNQTLVSICDGGRIIKWNAASGEKEREWVMSRGKVFNSIALTYDCRYVAAGDSEGTISLFRLYPRHEGE